MACAIVTELDDMPPAPVKAELILAVLEAIKALI